MKRPAMSRSGARVAGAPSSYQKMKKDLKKEVKKEKRNRRIEEQKNLSLQKELSLTEDRIAAESQPCQRGGL